MSKGYERYITQRGYKVVRLHYTADEDKRSAAWQKAAQMSMPDETSYRREYEIDWSASSGKPLYPEFMRAFGRHKDYFIKSFKPLEPPAPIWRGWDFGFRMPAVVWGQVTGQNRVLMLHELRPQNIDIHSFRDLVMFLSGEIDEDDKSLLRRPRAIEYIQQLRDKEFEVPFFARGKYQFPFNYSSVEATQVRPIEGEKGERDNAEVLAQRHVYITPLPQRQSVGENIIRRLFHPYPDGDAGILFRGEVSDRFSIGYRTLCPLLVSGLNGGLTYKKQTKMDPLSDKCAKDGWFEHTHDALRYLVNGAVTLEEQIPGPETPKAPGRDVNPELLGSEDMPEQWASTDPDDVSDNEARWDDIEYPDFWAAEE